MNLALKMRHVAVILAAVLASAGAAIPAPQAPMAMVTGAVTSQPIGHYEFCQRLPADDVVLTLIRDGDHRLSRPQDLQKMEAAVAALIIDDEKLG